MLAVLSGDRVDQQVGVVLEVVFGPHDLVPSHLLGGQDGFLDRRQGADLTQLAELHVLESLGIFGQAHVAHAALNIVHKPALAKHDDYRNVLASDVACILKDFAA